MKTFDIIKSCLLNKTEISVLQTSINEIAGFQIRPYDYRINIGDNYTCEINGLSHNFRIVEGEK